MIVKLPDIHSEVCAMDALHAVMALDGIMKSNPAALLGVSDLIEEINRILINSVWRFKIWRRQMLLVNDRIFRTSRERMRFIRKSPKKFWNAEMWMIFMPPGSPPLCRVSPEFIEREI